MLRFEAHFAEVMKGVVTERILRFYVDSALNQLLDDIHRCVLRIIKAEQMQRVAPLSVGDVDIDRLVLNQRLKTFGKTAFVETAVQHERSVTVKVRTTVNIHFWIAS